MMTIIIRVAAGTRPPVQSVSHEWPNETQHMAELMRRCWDQDPEKRPNFLGTSRKWEDGHRTWQRALQRYGPPWHQEAGADMQRRTRWLPIGVVLWWAFHWYQHPTACADHKVPDVGGI